VQLALLLERAYFPGWHALQTEAPAGAALPARTACKSTMAEGVGLGAALPARTACKSTMAEGVSLGKGFASFHTDVAKTTRKLNLGQSSVNHLVDMIGTVQLHPPQLFLDQC
jgi:hypothetical protein